MKQKSTLLLMEQLTMLLVFGLAAALCLQLFAKADDIRQETERLDTAVVLAQNAANTLKATCGDVDAAAALGAEGYEVQITEIPTGGKLGKAQIQIFYEGSALFSLTTGWQEADP